jgi:4'-phosphopantetheinyl transferase
MPLTEIRHLNEHTLIGFWKIEESFQELMQELYDIRPQQEIARFKSEMRQKEWLASRILATKLLNHFTSLPHEIISDQNGKPEFFPPGFHVSISQSGGQVAVMVSENQEVGIDIEIIREKALKLAFKFLSETELANTNGDITRTSLYWSAKETLYKMYSRKKLLFKENINVGPVKNKNKGVLEGSITTDNFCQTYAVHFEKNDNFILTYCLA